MPSRALHLAPPLTSDGGLGRRGCGPYLYAWEEQCVARLVEGGAFVGSVRLRLRRWKCGFGVGGVWWPRSPPHWRRQQQIEDGLPSTSWQPFPSRVTASIQMEADTPCRR
ncbi:unnamed protein product [Urochloa humidicola]